MKLLKDLEKNYDLELARVEREIRKQKARFVLLQFPDGLKPYATAVVDFLEKKLKGVKFAIWLGDCFGACDTPVGIEKMNFDLVVQFGHNEMMPI